MIGDDLSRIQPRLLPPNCEFVVEDFEEDWRCYGEDHFDFIHGRTLSGYETFYRDDAYMLITVMHSSVKDWKDLLAKTYKYVSPFQLGRDCVS